jgi:hypothetical protein
LCDSYDEDGMLAISLYPLEFFLHMSYFPFASTNSQDSNSLIPFMRGTSMLTVIDYLKAMSLAMHANSELRYLNYDNFCIKIVPCIPTTFNGDVLFEFPTLNSLNDHFS